MKVHVLTSIAILLSPLSIFGRVGEAASELISRYGEPLAHSAANSNGDPEAESFAYEGWGIRVYLLQGRSVYEEFSEFQNPQEAHADPKRARVSSEISQRSIDLILGANAHGKQWRPIDGLTWKGRRWQKGSWAPDHEEQLIDAWALDGQPLFALRTLFIDKERLTVCSQEWIDYVSQLLGKNREKEAKKSGL